MLDFVGKPERCAELRSQCESRRFRKERESEGFSSKLGERKIVVPDDAFILCAEFILDPLLHQRFPENDGLSHVDLIQETGPGSKIQELYDSLLGSPEGRKCLSYCVLLLPFVRRCDNFLPHLRCMWCGHLILRRRQTVDQLEGSAPNATASSSVVQGCHPAGKYTFLSLKVLALPWHEENREESDYYAFLIAMGQFVDSSMTYKKVLCSILLYKKHVISWCEMVQILTPYLQSSPEIFHLTVVFFRLSDMSRPCMSHHGCTSANTSVRVPSRNPIQKWEMPEELGVLCGLCFKPCGYGGEHFPMNLECGHFFGQSCLEKWLKGCCPTGPKRPICPKCRTPITEGMRRICMTDFIVEKTDNQGQRSMLKVAQSYIKISKSTFASLRCSIGLDITCFPTNDEEMPIDYRRLCPICLDAWTESGEHSIVSLSCGHLFGRSCVESWLAGDPNTAVRGCPLCKTLAHMKDIRCVCLLRGVEEQVLRNQIKEAVREWKDLEDEIACIRRYCSLDVVDLVCELVKLYVLET